MGAWNLNSDIWAVSHYPTFWHSDLWLIRRSRFRQLWVIFQHYSKILFWRSSFGARTQASLVFVTRFEQTRMRFFDVILQQVNFGKDFATNWAFVITVLCSCMLLKFILSFKRLQTFVTLMLWVEGFKVEVELTSLWKRFAASSTDVGDAMNFLKKTKFCIWISSKSSFQMGKTYPIVEWLVIKISSGY